MIFSSKGLSIDTEIQSDVFIIGDLERFRQVMNNLLSNSYKYTHSGGIRVILEKKEEGFLILVQDTGVGISEKDLPFIFERFYRADPSRTRETGGAGIGLAIAKRIIEAQGFKISVKSKLSEGTTFTISS